MKSAHQTAAWLCALTLSGVACIVLWQSLGNPIRADLAMLHYSGFLMQEKNFLLYRDILEINFPAPFLTHQLLGATLGYEALPLRWLDVGCLAGLCWMSWHILQSVSRPAAVAGPTLFTLFYLVHGAEYTLEREFLLLLPVSAAFLAATASTLSLSARALFIGALCGVACSFKPNAIVAVPALLAVLCLQNPTWRTVAIFWHTSLFAGMAFLAVFLLPFSVIWQQGVLDDFVKLYQTFLPIYSNTRYDLFHYSSTAEYWNTLIRNYLLYGGASILLSGIGVLWARANGADSTRLWQLMLMAVAFSFYEVFAGKFWTSHMIPSMYWTCLCTGLLLRAPESGTWRYTAATAGLLSLVYFGGTLGIYTWRGMETYAAEQRTGQNPGVLAGQFLLQQKLEENETVQVLDMAGHGQACLLMARATSATRHLIDVPLYLQPEHPVTLALREEFIHELTAKKPAFIVYFEQYLHPGGGNRLKEFSALDRLITEHYQPAQSVDGAYTVYRRLDRPATTPEAE